MQRNAPAGRMTRSLDAAVDVRDAPASARGASQVRRSLALGVITAGLGGALRWSCHAPLDHARTGADLRGSQLSRGARMRSTYFGLIAATAIAVVLLLVLLVFVASAVAAPRW
jgi:hypothetical protein